MGRPKVDLPDPEAIMAIADAEGRLAVRVTPGARSGSLEIVDGKLVAKVRAKPKDGEANEAVLELVAAALVIAKSRLTLLRGAASREKLFGIDQ